MNNHINANVLVTRPKPFGSALAKAIAEKNGKAILCPTIAFEAIHPTPLLKDLFVDAPDWLIFVSPHAASSFNEAVPAGCRSAAIGEGTMRALTAKGITVNAVPEAPRFNSEALLSLPEFNAPFIAGKKIVIVSGEGGREIVQAELKSRGAKVSAFISYRRILPKIDITIYKQMMLERKINVVVCTSYTGVKHYKTLFTENSNPTDAISPAAIWPILQEIPLLVVSERIKKLAHDLGFRTIWVSFNATTVSIVDSLIKYSSGKE